MYYNNADYFKEKSMTWQEIYQSKLTTADEAIKLIHDNDKIVV